MGSVSHRKDKAAPLFESLARAFLIPRSSRLSLKYALRPSTFSQDHHHSNLSKCRANALLTFSASLAGRWLSTSPSWLWRSSSLASMPLEFTGLPTIGSSTHWWCVSALWVWPSTCSSPRFTCTRPTITGHFWRYISGCSSSGSSNSRVSPDSPPYGLDIHVIIRTTLAIPAAPGISSETLVDFTRGIR